MDWQILRFDVLGSTNTRALELAKGGAREGTVVLADSQTAGRGREDRKWHSPPGLGLYFTALLYPPFRDRRLFFLPVLAGVSVAAAVRKVCNIPALLKWPNDVYVNGKKVCGILIEAAHCRGLVAQPPSQKRLHRAAAVGIGINVLNKSLPPELAEYATSLQIECANAPDKEELLNEILAELAIRYRKFLGGEVAALSSEAKKVSLLLGSIVKVSTADGESIGEAIDLNETGELLLRLPDGSICAFSTGEVKQVMGSKIERRGIVYEQIQKGMGRENS